MTLLNQPIRSHRVNEEQLCIARLPGSKTKKRNTRHRPSTSTSYLYCSASTTMTRRQRQQQSNRQPSNVPSLEALKGRNLLPLHRMKKKLAVTHDWQLDHQLRCRIGSRKGNFDDTLNILLTEILPDGTHLELYYEGERGKFTVHVRVPPITKDGSRAASLVAHRTSPRCCSSRQTTQYYWQDLRHPFHIPLDWRGYTAR